MRFFGPPGAPCPPQRVWQLLIRSTNEPIKASSGASLPHHLCVPSMYMCGQSIQPFVHFGCKTPDPWFSLSHKRLVVAGCHCTACNTTARREYEEELVPSIFGGMRGHIHARHTGASSQPQRCRSPHKHHSAHRLLLLAPSSSSSALPPETFAAAALLFFFAPSLPRANCPMWQNILQSWH